MSITLVVFHTIEVEFSRSDWTSSTKRWMRIEGVVKFPPTKISYLYWWKLCHTYTSCSTIFTACAILPRVSKVFFWSFTYSVSITLGFFILCRWKLLQVGLDEQYKKLNEIRRRGEVPTNQDFLSVAVHYPWARAISQNKVPYYINHQTETTHWDHPDMVNLFKNLTEFNKVSWY